MSGQTPAPDPKEVLEVLKYEWEMFQALRSIYEWNLFRLLFSVPVQNAVLESLLVHGRVLTEFFFEKPQRPHQQPHQHKDLTVDNLGQGLAQQSFPQVLEDWKRNVDKRLAHMTETRLTPNVGWDVLAVCQPLETQINLVRGKFPGLGGP